MGEVKENQVQEDLFGNKVVSDNDNVYLNKNKKSKDKKDLSDTISTEFVLEIVCMNAEEQEMFYNELIKRGFTCRVLTL